MHIPSWGSSHSSRAPAHGRLALVTARVPEVPASGCWRDEAVPRCDPRSSSKLGELLALRGRERSVLVIAAGAR